MPTPLETKICELIFHHGPVSVADYFALCLADPEHGYYKTKEPFGREGDFTTAPEISQLFGEMIGIYLIQSWQKHQPEGKVHLVEIGPGRGALMKDALRVIKQSSRKMFDQISIHMVETSPRLIEIQAKTLDKYHDKIQWHETFEDVPEGFTLLVANELFDAIPIRQFIKTENGFRERVVTLDSHENLMFSAGVAGIDPELLPSNHKDQPQGTIFEIAPARANVMATIADRLAKNSGSALIIDYGHLARGFGDTLQAIFRHEYDPPLAKPGLADITSHVDFETLLHISHAAGAHIHGLMHQGDFLVGLGLLQRAGALGHNKTPEIQNDIRSAVERLAAEGEGNMGELFKVLAISGQPLELAPFVINNTSDDTETSAHS
jgi:SAM-dependent MidA family methyltransferase